MPCLLVNGWPGVCDSRPRGLPNYQLLRTRHFRLPIHCLFVQALAVGWRGTSFVLRPGTRARGRRRLSIIFVYSTLCVQHHDLEKSIP